LDHITGGLGNFSDLKFFTQFFCDRKKFHKFFPPKFFCQEIFYRKNFSARFFYMKFFCPEIFARENFRAESPDFWSVNLD